MRIVRQREEPTDRFFRSGFAEAGHKRTFFSEKKLKKSANACILIGIEDHIKTKEFQMGQQYNKVQKRARRKRYNERLKARVKAAIKAAKKK